MYFCMFICLYVCMYVCLCLCICVYVAKLEVRVKIWRELPRKKVPVACKIKVRLKVGESYHGEEPAPPGRKRYVEKTTNSIQLLFQNLKCFDTKICDA